MNLRGGLPQVGRAPLILPGIVLAVLAMGAGLRLAGHGDAAAMTWWVGLGVTGMPLVWQTVRQALSGHFATDVVASLAVITAVVALAVSGDWNRVLAVLVVATPCPLILATPVAIIGGVNNAARHHVVVRHGGALEQLASVTVAVLDKTGTLTIGAPEVREVAASNGIIDREVLRLAAAVEHGSGHLLARSVVHAAALAGLDIAQATDVRESPGRGVSGIVDGRRICVGSSGFASECARDKDGGTAADHIGMPAFIADLGSLGISRTLLLSGDTSAHTMQVAREVGIPEVHGELLPEDKVRIVKELVAAGESPT